jgi:hypothetical protein
MQLKKGFYLILLMLFIPLMGILYLNNTYKKSIESVKIPVVMPSQIVQDIVDEAYAKKKIIEEPTMPKYSLNLSEDLQKYIWDLSLEYDLSYEYILALIYVESGFNSKAVNKNNNGTYDLGLTQQNSKYAQAMASRAGIKGFDPMNPYHSIKTCVVKLRGLKDYWINRGITSEEELWFYVSNGYNMGNAGYSNYVKRTGKLSREYDQKISKYKTMLEVEGMLP